MMITGYASVAERLKRSKSAPRSIWPNRSPRDELLSAVAATLRKLHARRALARRDPAAKIITHGIIGNSPAMKKVYTLIARAAATTATILIGGESGTGKELVARAIHYSSSRAAAPFVPVNCGGIPENLLESELFGYLKGAFTGATESRAGFFQTADGGTIFLDEISEITLAMQVNLLRVLQDKEVCMLGSRKTQAVDVRIIAATNKDLQRLVEKGLFREDLYFRLNVLHPTTATARPRRRSAASGSSFLSFAQGIGGDRVSPTRPWALRGYDWPGNVRELENVMQRLVVMSESDSIDVSDLPALMRLQSRAAAVTSRTLAPVEAEYIRHVLANVGNRTRAAQILAIDRKTLREKLKRYGIVHEA